MVSPLNYQPTLFRQVSRSITSGLMTGYIYICLGAQFVMSAWRVWLSGCFSWHKLDPMFPNGGTHCMRVLHSGGFREVQMHPPLWWLIMYFCVHNCTSPSNDHAAMACSNNNQAQLHIRVSVPYSSPDNWLGLELLRDIQFRQNPNWISQSNSSHECIHATGSGRGNPKIFRCALRASGWTPLSKFLNPPLLQGKCLASDCMAH